MDTFQRAQQLYLAGHVHDALEAAQSACEQRPKDADAWWLLGCVSRHAGLLQASDVAFARASRLAGDRPPPIRVDGGRFGRLLEEVRSALPGDLRERLGTVTVRVEAVPAEEMVESGVRPDALSTRARDPEELLVVYQVNIENRSADEQALRRLIEEVLRQA